MNLKGRKEKEWVSKMKIRIWNYKRKVRKKKRFVKRKLGKRISSG